MPPVLYCCGGGCRVDVSLFPAGDGFGFGTGSGLGDGGFIPTRRDGPSPPDLPPSCFAFLGMLVAAMVCRRMILPAAPADRPIPAPPDSGAGHKEVS